jgi:hypothetical protein
MAQGWREPSQKSACRRTTKSDPRTSTDLSAEFRLYICTVYFECPQRNHLDYRKLPTATLPFAVISELSSPTRLYFSDVWQFRVVLLIGVG